VRTLLTDRKLDRRWENALKPWSEADIEYLGEKYGMLSLRAICKHLQRSPNAIKVASFRKLHHGMKANFYTAREVARLFGISCAKTIVGWMEQGWLNGRRSFARAGPNIAWCFTEENIKRCLRQRPWLCDLKKMERHYFRTIVQEEYDKDPWYSCAEAAGLIGLKSDDAVMRYIYRKWLPAVKRPGGPWQGQWIIRQSDIHKFLASDPRPNRSQYVSSSRKALRLQRGLPVRLALYWSVLCRLCGQRVIIMANPRLKGHQVQEQFHQIYTNGKCNHGRQCAVGLQEAA